MDRENLWMSVTRVICTMVSPLFSCVALRLPVYSIVDGCVSIGCGLCVVWVGVCVVHVLPSTQTSR